MPEQNASKRLSDTIDTLLGPEGCAWHRAQSHDSLVRYLIEEAAELAEAIDAAEGADRVREELGDVLYQVLFHAAIADRDGEGYGLDEVMDTLTEKLIRRHPHVFGDRGPMTVAELDAEWEHLKADAANAPRASRGPLEGIPAAMPGLARAVKMIDRLSRTEDPRARKALAAAAEPPAASPGQDQELETREQALGRELLATLIAAHCEGLDSDRALRGALRDLERAATVTPNVEE